MGPHHGRDAFGAVAQGGEILAGNAELHRVADRRPVLHAHHAQAQMRPRTVRGVEGGLQPALHFFALLEPLGDNEHLPEIVGEQLLVERQHEARRTVADVGRPGGDAFVLRQQ